MSSDRLKISSKGSLGGGLSALGVKCRALCLFFSLVAGYHYGAKLWQLQVGSDVMLGSKVGFYHGLAN